MTGPPAVSAIPNAPRRVGKFSLPGSVWEVNGAARIAGSREEEDALTRSDVAQVSAISLGHDDDGGGGGS